LDPAALCGLSVPGADSNFAAPKSHEMQDVSLLPPLAVPSRLLPVDQSWKKTSFYKKFLGFGFFKGFFLSFKRFF